MADYLIQGLALLMFLPGLLGLELTELTVPSHANLGHSITLYCWFNLDANKLYSVKWYKDEFEFFRFMPANKPEMQVFPLAGIMLDESQSDMNKVSLAELNFNSSGNYRCEVSTEAPNFETRFKSSNMTVLAYPDRSPVISGTQAHYLPGDYITANCTSGQSNPPAELEWLINGAKADTWFLEKSEPLETSSRGPLFTHSLGLRFQAHKRYFQSVDSTVHLRCTARVADLQPQHVDFYPHLSTHLTNEKLAQEIHASQGTALHTQGAVQLLMMLVSHSLLNML
ncbi:uncharacterized protein LOC124359540 isoform X1 [Homalodisca vitripennis]|uniref:uncharacterized protein LOC124359540 isoform X1 n=1 Tax=Homalodisca vitripennis TaxID=197043 RepID=UPI001EEBE642|nr:uncharacterized protein LOC124359540 isoform X1 [Homalodisca vitripennis]XP_046668311.1 uncharacterized protein LOC124359540 isoform X1 [Homalodisca vitripennis]